MNGKKAKAIRRAIKQETGSEAAAVRPLYLLVKKGMKESK